MWGWVGVGGGWYSEHETMFSVKLQVGTEEVWALCTCRLGTWNEIEVFGAPS